MTTRLLLPPSGLANSRSAGRVFVGAVLILLSLSVHAAAAAALVVDDDGMAVAGDCNAPNPTFLTISAAVAAASSGDTIQVCPGTYVENINLAKSLTLLGAQAHENACGRATTDESVVTPLIATAPTVELDTGSAGSIINGFSFIGGTRAIISDTGPIDGLQLLNNRIRQFTGNGVFLDDNGLNITADQNEIDGSSKVGGGGLFHLDTDNFDGFWFTNNCVLNGLTGTGFFVDGNRNVDKSTSGARTPRFAGNVLDKNGTGVNLGSRAWGDGPISGNVISNSLFDGLQGGPKDSSIHDNWFDNNGRNGLALTSFGNTADPLRGAQNNTIRFNCFTRNGFPQMAAGILFSATQFPGTISTNVAQQNNIIDNFMGARYPLPGTETIDATNNWWGAPDGPGPPDGTGSGDGVDGHMQIDFTPWRTTAVGGTLCGAGPPTTLTLDPPHATNPVDTQHCVTATVQNALGIPLSGVTVRFMVTGSVITGGSDTTDTNGEATFCYTGPALPGTDAISAYADTDNDNTQDPDEPFDTATKTWVFPMTTPGCEIIITNGGWIIANNGDRANFGGNAKADEDGNVSGQEEYQDQGPVEPFNLHGNVLAITCTSPTEATIFGEAAIDGAGSHPYRIDVKDLAEPGKGIDTYRMRVNTYDSGEQKLQGGNIQIHQ